MKRKYKIHLIAAARPNFMKIAPLYHALKNESWAEPIIIHTGQHYDHNMSDTFFKDLNLPDPYIHLGIGSGTHAEQTGQVMIAYEKVLLDAQPDMVIVVGDVNSTMACTIAAAKVSYPSSHHNGCRPVIAHLEAGLRSFDHTMPEEINRLVTDSLADILWTPSRGADKNLLKEGIAKEKIHRVGNIMIDSLEMMRQRIEQQNTCDKLGLVPKSFGLVTLHRPANVDTKENLSKILSTLETISKKIPIVFPIHPRTKKQLNKFNLLHSHAKKDELKIIDPLDYVSFMNLLFNCKFVITDSGGIQEETTYLGIHCLTIRPNTERPITITQGTNQLVDPDTLESHLEALLNKNEIKHRGIDLWDGNTAQRAVIIIKDVLN